MEKLGVLEDDLEEKFVLGSGPGGQKINKTASCVYLRHAPTGFEVKFQGTRSRAANRAEARSILCDRIEAERQAKKDAAKHAREKERRRKRQKSKGQKRRMVADKRKRGETKKLRRKPGAGD
ncbi:MAG: peptide chain release factor-like protein [Verrucomicrobiales bacterium]